MKILLPKTLCEIDPNYGPFFFLGGPVRGGGDWQLECCMEIRKYVPHFYAALPCRYKGTHPLLPYRMAGKENVFERQLSWERHYLEFAATRGCLLFWLPCESKTNPRHGDGPYAMDTRGELGEWRGRMMHNKDLHVVVGAEPGFHGLSQIERNFNQALGYKFPIYSTLADTIAAAIAHRRQ